MKKFLAATAALAITATPVAAQERTFVTNPPTNSGAGVTYNSGTNTVTATAADGARLYSITRPIERGAKYTYELTVSGYTAGSVQPYVGTIRDSFTGPTLASPNTGATTPRRPGAASIADNFVTANGIEAAALQTIQSPLSGDTLGAFRFFCAAGPVKSDDALVVANKPGAAHMHQFFGNTGVNAYSTHQSLRTSGGSTCGTDQANPINRSAYWFPAMGNGRGGIIKPSTINVYYKRGVLNDRQCTDPEATRAGICVGMPNGLNMIWGYNMATMSQPIANARGRWSCRVRNGVDQAQDGGDPQTLARGPSIGVTFAYDNLQLLRNAGVCPSTAAIVVETQAPPCWNGTQLQTPDHRAHLTYGAATNGNFYGTCPASHPYHIPVITLQIYFDVDSNLNNWRLSSDDQMGMGVAAGETFHTDFMMAWSPAYLQSLEESCLDVWRSCSGGQNGIGTAIKQGNISSGRTRILPLVRQGLGRTRNANGTYTGEFTAPADGEFGLNFLLFTGNVTGFKVTKITKGARGPVTIGTTQ